ncbi:MAG: Na/Pi cotransporter family protein [Rikenellaceae bacterium]|nr:Na/Pi cotransporter family protein [Rikenellaceae bacterium]
MGHTILQALTIIGSLGLFLFGMKLMSESLQKVAGNKLRDILAAMTSNTFKRILVGALITAVIQSSSATTVMIISFVNAGLLSLVQSIGMIMGANIGTTSTAWLISLFGFKFDLGMAALPLIAIGFPLMFAKRGRTKSIGEMIIGFSILFMGLNLLKDSMNGLQQDPAILSFLADFSNNGFASVLLFVLIGTVLTIIIQSSSATMALTIIMCNNGWINFDCAAAMVLGENIGTTVTANIAAFVANSEAQKAARAHLIFNIIGVFWMLMIFPAFIKMIVGILELFGGASPIDNPTSRPVALALFHTLFNIINTLLLVGFTPQIAKFSSKLVKTKESPISRLTHMESGMLSTSELSIVQAYNELSIYSKRSSKMFGFVRNLFKETNQDEFDRIYQRIEKYENISDSIESEIYHYLDQTTSDDMGSESFRRIETLFKVISDIETMSDRNFRLAKIIKTKRDNGIWFNQDLRDGVNKMFDLVEKAIKVMTSNVNSVMEENKNTSLNEVYEIEEQINNLEIELKQKYVYNTDERDFKYSSGVIFAEIISETERLADTVKKVSAHIMNIAPHSKPE